MFYNLANTRTCFGSVYRKCRLYPSGWWCWKKWIDIGIASVIWICTWKGKHYTTNP